MIKKAGHILIIFLLLLGATGLTITRHYCGKNLIRTTIFSSPDNCCKGSCPFCHNEKITFRITDNFETSQVRIDFNEGFKTLLNQHSLPTLLAFSSIIPSTSLYYSLGGYCIKPSRADLISAGHSTQFLQVFLF
jgi:hypothetical protein